MYNEIKLFIQGREVDFNTPPQILYNYNVTDLTNPTIVQNSFSKSIQVEGTPANNDLFGHIWRLDRVQSYDEDGGVSFNAMRRATFELYVNGEKYESGYVRLNTITKNEDHIVYDITLFGGIGSFFYSLNYADDESNLKKTLADLDYSLDGYSSVLDLDFNINADTVDTAWFELRTGNAWNDKFHMLNFAVTSEGVPEDFSANKVLVNTYGMSKYTTEKDGHKPILNGRQNNNGYVLGEANQDLTMDNTFDLRSYLLRPVIKVKNIIQACRRPEVNGGYFVDLDPHFFNDTNPYYEDAWMTLKNLRDLNIEREDTHTITGATLTTDSSTSKWYSLNISDPYAAQATGMKFSIYLQFRPSTTTSVTTLYPYRKLTTTATGGWAQDRVTNQEWNTGVIVQAFAYDASDTEVARSKAYYCGSRTQCLDGYSNYDMWHKYIWKNNTNFKSINGRFVRGNGNTYYFSTDGGSAIPVEFDFTGINFSYIKVYIANPANDYTQFTWGGPQYHMVAERSTGFLYTQGVTNLGNTNIDGPTAIARNRVEGTFFPSVAKVDAKMTVYTSLFSNTLIPKDKLLHTEFSPADFLLSYAKLFGLYFYRDATEESGFDEYPNGVIHIVDRNTFYTDEVVNLHQLIDRGKEITITPTTAENKWYSFDVEAIGSELQQKYENTYGRNYGSQLVNTNFNFNNNTVNLYDGNVFKSGLMAMERNRYFAYPLSAVPAYTYNHFKYDLFKPNGMDYDSTSIDFPSMVYDGTPINSEGFGYYDSMPKLQVHSEELGSNDGSGVLLFYDGFKTTQSSSGAALVYWLTDDVADMGLLNDGDPCWIQTNYGSNANGEVIGYAQYSLPIFTRDLTVQGRITNSWNFGHPQEMYVPETFTGYGDDIYDKCWQKYISDLYDVNNRKLSCFVKLMGKPNPMMLRKFYWFDNALWRINSIKDWNISSLDTTAVEFVKVIDAENYKMDKITRSGGITIVLYDYTIGQAGGQIWGKIWNRAMGMMWTFADVIKVTDGVGNTFYLDSQDWIRPMTGSGLETNFYVNVNNNSGLTDWTYTLTVIDGYDARYTVQFVQEANSTPIISFINTASTAPIVGGIVSETFVTRKVNENTLSVSSNQTWARPSVVGNSVVIEVDRNSGLSRSASITLSGESNTGISLSSTLTLTQPSGGISVNPQTVEFDFYDSNVNRQISISVGQNVEWTITEES